MIEKRWPDSKCIVAATGPSLTPAVAERCNAAHATHKIIAVNDAYKLLPAADVLYACDATWWTVHKGCPGFAGEKWSQCEGGESSRGIEKRGVAQQYGLKLVDGAHADTFSLNPALIHYGSNSGFQAVNLALLFGAIELVLVGFDMRTVNGQMHFFGKHPRPLNNPGCYDTFLQAFRTAAQSLPPWIKITNATPDSALTCFPMAPLESCL
jgi:hypothetical protein